MTIFRVIDFETTGLEPPQAGVIEVGWTDVSADPATGVNVCTPQNQLLDPGPACPMQIEAQAVHHIAPEEYQGQPRPQDYLPKLEAGVAVFVAHKADFEQKFFKTKLPWICTLKCAHNLCMEAPSFGNQVLRYHLGHDLEPAFNKTLALPPHRAAPDTYVTAWTFRALLARAVTRFGDPSRAVGAMIKMTLEPEMPPRCPIGKARGQLWRDVDGGFLNWMVKNIKEENLRKCAQRELTRRSQ